MATHAVIEPVTYTVKNLAELLDCSLPTAYRAVREEIIPSFRIGKRYFIPRIAIDEKLACKKQIKRLREKMNPEELEASDRSAAGSRRVRG